MTMDYKYIEQLLEKYFECETSLEEEQILRAFFSQESVPVRLLPYRSLFAEAQGNSREEVLDSTFDRKVLEMIGGLEEKEPQRVKARVVSMQRRLRPLYKAAACVAVVLAIGQAAQMPYERETEGSENIARSIDHPGIQKVENTVAKTDSMAKSINDAVTPVAN